jgi:hypothetical protein
VRVYVGEVDEVAIDIGCDSKDGRSQRGAYALRRKHGRRAGPCIELKGSTRGLAAAIFFGLSYVSTFFATSRRAPAFDGET